MKPFASDKNNYTLYGALFGIAFPIGAIALELVLRELSLSLQNIIFLHQEILLLWMIDSAPLWLGIFARFAGIKQDAVNETLVHMQEVIAERTKHLEESKNAALKANQEKDRLSELSQITTTAKNTADLTRSALSYVLNIVEAKTGLLYKAENNKLKLIASYALVDTKRYEQEFNFGESLVGQCALERKKLIVSSVEYGYFSIGSALGEAKVNALALIPIIFENELLGVIEAGAFHAFSDKQIEFLEHAASVIGISLQASFAREKLSELIAQLKADARTSA